MISYYDFDHGIRKAEGGSDMFYNLTPRLREEHREKTRKIDIPEIAKNKRRASKHEAHRLRMAEKEAGVSARQIRNGIVAEKQELTYDRYDS